MSPSTPTPCRCVSHRSGISHVSDEKRFSRRVRIWRVASPLCAHPSDAVPRREPARPSREGAGETGLGHVDRGGFEVPGDRRCPSGRSGRPARPGPPRSRRLPPRHRRDRPRRAGVEAAGAWAARCARHEVDFRLERPGTPLTITTDGFRVRQLVDGLAENALRVTPAGKPLVLALRAEGPGAVLEVRDGGPGLTDDDIAVAFRRGTLTDRYRGVRPVGSGPALASRDQERDMPRRAAVDRFAEGTCGNGFRRRATDAPTATGRTTWSEPRTYGPEIT